SDSGAQRRSPYGSAAAGVIGIPRSCCPAFHQHRFPLPGNAILRGRDKGAETAPEIPSTHCRDKMRARIPASSGLFALNREISVCVRLRGGPGRTRTGNQPPRVATYQMQKELDFSRKWSVSVAATYGP